jgi:preprotein translocase subunit YajC
VIIGASNSSGFLFIIIIAFLLIWLIVVRPQRRRQTEQQQMLGDLRVGDEVLTAGGIYGTILELEDDLVTVEIAPKTVVRVARRAIAGVTREPEPGEDGEDGEPEEPQAEEGEGEGPVAETSNEENRG